ncbi:hypothetical protein SprV_0501872800 [Sparganum proliferum]
MLITLLNPHYRPPPPPPPSSQLSLRRLMYPPPLHTILTHQQTSNYPPPTSATWNRPVSVLIVTTLSPYTPAWSVTGKSIAQRLANQCLDHQPTLAAFASTVHTAPAHSLIAWASSATCVSTRAELTAHTLIDTLSTSCTSIMTNSTQLPSPSTPTTISSITLSTSFTPTMLNSTHIPPPSSTTINSFIAATISISDTNTADISCPLCPLTFASHIGMIGHLRIYRIGSIAWGINIHQTHSPQLSSLHPHMYPPHGSIKPHAHSRKPAVDNFRLNHTTTSSPTYITQHHPPQASNCHLLRKW